MKLVDLLTKRYSTKKAVRTLVTLVKIAKKYPFSNSRQIIQVDNTEVHVLGNGPSLNSTLNSYGARLLSTKDCICVNTFAKTDIYEVIKPKYYVLMDPGYWLDGVTEDDGLNEDYIKSREQLFSIIECKTTWNLSILLPLNAKIAYDWEGRFKNNANIRCCFFNDWQLDGFTSVKHYLYKHNLGMPNGPNVLIGAIFIAINIGYKRIYLHGADHSWHEDLVVNNDNVVCRKEKHFYDESDAKLIPYIKADGTPYRMHEILMYLARIFNGYHELQGYSRYRNVTIYNASIKSHIDVFERRLI